MAQASRLKVGMIFVAIVALLVGATGLLVCIYEAFADLGRNDIGSFGTVLRVISGTLLVVVSLMELTFAVRMLRRMYSARRLGIWAQLGLILAALSRVDSNLQNQPYDMYLRWGMLLVAVCMLGYLVLSSAFRSYERSPASGQTGLPAQRSSPGVELVAALAIVLGVLGILSGLVLIALLLWIPDPNTSSVMLQIAVLMVGSSANVVFGIAVLRAAPWAWGLGVATQCALVITVMISPVLRGFFLLAAPIPLGMLLYLVSPGGSKALRKALDYPKSAGATG